MKFVLESKKLHINSYYAQRFFEMKPVFELAV